MFNEVELLINQTIQMRLSLKESLNWLKAHDHGISQSRYYQIKHKIMATSDKRKFDLTKKGIFEQHLERIDQLELILKLSWQNYHLENDVYKKQKILESIAMLQPLLSRYYEASIIVIQNDAKRLETARPLPADI